MEASEVKFERELSFEAESIEDESVEPSVADVAEPPLSTSMPYNWFTAVKINLYRKAEDFTKLLMEVQSNPYYIELKTNKPAKCRKVFGNLEPILKLHQKLHVEFEECKSVDDILQVFLQHEQEFRLHVEDEWKGPDKKAEDAGVNYKFYSEPMWQIKSYMDRLTEVKYEERNRHKPNDLQNDPNFKKAFSIVLDVYTQMQFINNALKLIVDAPVLINECGLVLYKEKFTIVPNIPLLTKNEEVDIVITEKYVLITKAKDDKNVCYDCWPVKDVTLLEQKDKVKMCYGLFNKRSFTLDMKNRNGACLKLKNVLDSLEF